MVDFLFHSVSLQKYSRLTLTNWDINDAAYMLFGYRLDSGVEAKTRILESFVRTPENRELTNEKVTAAILVWEDIGERLADQTGDLVVPISGGLDSRLILSAIRKKSPNRRIRTFTFGPRGSFDYVYGGRVAKHYNTTHINYDLSDYGVSKDIIQNAEFITSPTNILFLPPLLAINRDFSPDKVTFLSGFMGDPSVGSHYPHTLDVIPSDYIFLKESRDGVDSQVLTNFPECASMIRTYLAHQGVKNRADIERWDILNRQVHGVLPKVQYANYSYQFPFLDSSWLGICARLSVDEMKSAKFYNQFLHCFDPQGFALPTKNYLGAGVPTTVRQKIKFQSMRLNRRIRLKTFKRKGANYFDSTDIHWRIWQENKNLIVSKIASLPLICGDDIDRLRRADKDQFSRYINLVGLGMGS